MHAVFFFKNYEWMLKYGKDALMYIWDLSPSFFSSSAYNTSNHTKLKEAGFKMEKVSFYLNLLAI